MTKVATQLATFFKKVATSLKANDLSGYINDKGIQKLEKEKGKSAGPDFMTGSFRRLPRASENRLQFGQDEQNDLNQNCILRILSILFKTACVKEQRV